MTEARLDTLGMIEAAASLGDQIRRAADTALALDRLPPAEGITSILMVGMGGSGIGAELCAAVGEPSLDVPIAVSRSYELPRYVDAGTLVMAVSFSGDTEETIEAATDAHRRGARLVIVAAGGELTRLGTEWGVPVLNVDPTIPMPRSAVGALTVSPLVVFERMGLVNGTAPMIAAAADQLDARAEKLMMDDSEAATLARHIGRTLPIVYGGGVLGDVAARRWKNQFNENAKVASFANSVPELTHTEICGWGQHGDVTRQVFSLVQLRHAFEHPRAARRFELVAEICDEVLADVHVIEAQGEDRLTQLLDLVMVGDFVSLELAVQSGVDPGPVPILDLIKTSMRE